MRCFTAPPVFAVLLVTLGLASGAQSGPTMFQASLIIHMYANDITTGTRPTSSRYTFYAMPPGKTCTYFTTWGPGAGYPYVCAQTTKQSGGPATGSGTISVPTRGEGPFPIALPQSALGVANSFPFWSSSTVYATFVNEAGSFFAGAGPGSLTFRPHNPEGGTAYIRPGESRFGGVMGLLGKMGDRLVWTHPTNFYGTLSWRMIPVIGRTTGFQDSGIEYLYTAGGLSVTTWYVIGTGLPWTTGMVTVYGTVGVFDTIARRSGYDNRTPMGLGNIQLVSPQITHWKWVGSPASPDTASIAILKISVPEPSELFLLGAGLVALSLIHRASRRSGCSCGRRRVH